MRKIGTLTSLIMCLFLITMLFSASAYKTEHHGERIHEYIAEVAGELYSNPEIEYYMNISIKHGAADEDAYDHVYDYSKALGGTTYTHFWDADNGENDLVQIAGGNYPNAWQKAKILWGMALGQYTKTPANKSQAYEYLGHIAHLLADMSVPAHAHEDVHTKYLQDDDCYEEWMDDLNIAELNPTEKDDLKAEGPVEIPDYDDPYDSLYYLFYTTNQVADYFASDDYDGDTNDYHGGWMDDIYAELGMDDINITRPTISDHLTKVKYGDNDIGNDNDDGDLGRIRNYSYKYAIRATAALYKLFEETISAEPITTLIIDYVKTLDKHDGPGIKDYPEYFAEVAIGGQWYMNRGDQIKEEDFNPGWAFGRDVGTTGTIYVGINLWDDDGIWGEEQSDIDPKSDDRGLSMWVNLATGAITGDVTGTCGSTIYSRGYENDASIIGFRILLPNIPPTVNAGSDKTVNEGDLVTFGGSYTDPNAGDTHTIEWDFGDGCTASGTLTPTHIYADDGTYAVTLTVTDNHGLSGSDTLLVTVNNVAPTVDAGAHQTVNEGDLVSLAPATFNDKGTLDTHTATINWGDGTSTEAGTVTESPFGPPGSTAGMDGTVSGTHVYADNGAYNVIVTVTDDDGAVTADTITISVNNVAPTLLAGVNQAVNEGDLIYLDPSAFNDKGTLDTHTATINWGDGTSSEPGSVSESPFGPPGSTAGMDGEIFGDHVYADNSDYTVTVSCTDDDGAVTADTFTITVHNVAPTVDAGSDQTAFEGDLVSLDPATFNDKGTLDTHTATIDWGDGSSLEVGTVSESPFGPPGSTAGATGTVSGSHTYGDNGQYIVTVTVTDDDGAVGSDTFVVTVENVAPTIEDIEAYMLINFTLRAAGEKWHNVEMFIYEDGVEIGYAEVVRSPGSPDDQSVTLYDVKCDITKANVVEVVYTPLDDPVNGKPNGATPVWVIIDFADGEDIKLHHTCNVKHEDTWEWSININQYLAGHEITFEASASDQGSDDLTFDWGWGDGTNNSVNTYYNNAPINTPDPYPSPWGTYPFAAVDTETHIYLGPGYYNITLTLTDDDGGIDSITIMLILM